MSKFAFLGAGNMASAMVDGMLANQIAAPADLICYSPSGRSASALEARTGIIKAESLSSLMKDADKVIVAFKPQHLAQADTSLAELTAGKFVISVLSGKRLASLRTVFPHARNVIRTMPNTPGRIGAGVTAWCSDTPLTPEDRSELERLLKSLGCFIEIGEEDMDAVTAVSGSGPGFIFEFAAAFRDAAIAAHLPPETAKMLVVETLLGSARLLARSAEEPETLRNQVTSPNGTTQAGLNRLTAGNFRSLITETVLAAQARAKEISKDS